ncbi:MAG: 2Fe-2S iron-sulfur cluster-binding protein [Kineosporiaceae bacterium]
MGRLNVVGTDVDIALKPGETILGALHRAGYAATSGCKRGGCGICKFDLVEGEISYREIVADTVLTPEERAAGTCLICRAIPENDATIATRPESTVRCVAPFLTALAR